MCCYDTIARVIITHCVGRGRSNYILSMISMMIAKLSVWVHYTGMLWVYLSALMCVPLSVLVCVPLSALECVPLSALVCVPLSALVCVPLSALICVPLSALICVPLSALMLFCLQRHAHWVECWGAVENPNGCLESTCITLRNQEGGLPMHHV